MEQQTQQAELNFLGKVAARLAEYGHNATRNISQGFSNMTPQGWIRLTVIVCGYMLLRPYIVKLSTKFAVKKLEQEDAKSRSMQAPAPALTPNQLRGIKEKIYEAQDEGDGSGVDWGSKARMRQRQMLKKLLEEE